MVEKKKMENKKMNADGAVSAKSPVTGTVEEKEKPDPNAYYWQISLNEIDITNISRFNYLRSVAHT
mgnify:CR=1 FL=1